MDGGQGDFGSWFGPMIGPDVVLLRYSQISGRSLHRGAKQSEWCVISRTLRLAADSCAEGGGLAPTLRLLKVSDAIASTLGECR